MTQQLEMPPIPRRSEALKVGRAILEAHGQWEKENTQRGSQDVWGEQHVILLGQAAMLAAAPQPKPDERLEQLEAQVRSATDAAQVLWSGEHARLQERLAKAMEALRSLEGNPTDEMIEAGMGVNFENEDERGTIINIWNAMSAEALRYLEGK